MKSEKFVRGVSILLISGIVAKLLGAIFRIPLTWVLGIDGLGLYQLIYPVFALLIVLSSSGMPTAVSKLVATKKEQNNLVGAKQVLFVSWIFFGLVSLIFSVGLFFLAEKIASIQGNELSLWGYRAISPAIFVVSFLSCLRGYFQGMNNMVPTALSQILEQGGKLVFGLMLAWLMLPNGVEFATSGALLGVSLSEVLATLVLFVIYFRQKKSLSVGEKQPFRVVLTELIVVAFPIVITSVVLPVLTFVDSFLVVNLLSSAFPVEVSTQLWGVSSGVVTSLINMPIALSLSVAVSIVPALISEQNKVGVLSKAFGLLFLFSVPVVLVFMILGESVISTLYGESFVLADKFQLAVKMIMFSSPIVILGSVLQTQTSALQTIGKGKLSLLSIFIAGGVKIGLTVWLVSIPSLNIWGFTIANFVFYSLAVSLNAYYIYRKVGFVRFENVKATLLGAILLTLVLLNVRLLVVAPVVKLLLALVLGGGLYLFSITLFGFDLKKLRNLLRIKPKIVGKNLS